MAFAPVAPIIPIPDEALNTGTPPLIPSPVDRYMEGLIPPDTSEFDVPESYPDHSAELGGPQIVEHTHLDVPIPLGKGNQLPKHTVDAVNGIQDLKLRGLIEKDVLGRGGLNGHGNETTNIIEENGTLADGEARFYELVDKLGVDRKMVNVIPSPENKGKILTYSLGDKQYITFRPVSRDEQPTLDLRFKSENSKNGLYNIKVRYGPKPPNP